MNQLYHFVRNGNSDAVKDFLTEIEQLLGTSFVNKYVKTLNKSATYYAPGEIAKIIGTCANVYELYGPVDSTETLLNADNYKGIYSHIDAMESSTYEIYHDNDLTPICTRDTDIWALVPIRAFIGTIDELYKTIAQHPSYLYSASEFETS